MVTFTLNKLVKDSVYESMLQMGQQPRVRILEDDAEFEAALHEKLLEEQAELVSSDNPEKELADIVAVARQIALLKGLDTTVLFAAAPDEPGLFDGRIFIIDLVLEDADEWVAYYREEPDRFPESTT